MSTARWNVNPKLSVVGVPYSYGQPKPGVDDGPTRMRKNGIVKNIESLGISVQDKGDLTFEDFPKETDVFDNIRRPRAVGEANKKISTAVTNVLRGGGVCLTLGGDHSLAIGSIHGHAQAEPDVGVIWIDAHADINPPAESPSGNIHGMPLAFLIRELRDTIPDGLPGFDWLSPCINIKNLAYIGLRDVDPPEVQILEKYGVAAFYMTDVRKLGLEAVVQKAIDAASPNLSRPIHLSYDIDALDPSFAPSTGTAVEGGLTLEEGVYITTTIAATGQLQVMDLVEVNPHIGTEADQEVTLASSNRVVSAWFERSARRQIGTN